MKDSKSSKSKKKSVDPARLCDLANMANEPASTDVLGSYTGMAEDFEPPVQDADDLEQGLIPLHLGLHAFGAQGRRGICKLAGVLPPWHDRCHGSPVWCSFPVS